MSEVARRLRIGRSTLYRKLEGLGLKEFEEDVAAE
jgi:DNA-binding NtrC family response regulator